MNGYDQLVFNEKRSNDGRVTCYNCQENYLPNGMMQRIPRQLNGSGKEFCDVECMLAYARDFMFDKEFARYHAAINSFMGREVVYIGSSCELQALGGTLSREEYKHRSQVPRFEPMPQIESNKRQLLCSDVDEDIEMADG